MRMTTTSWMSNSSAFKKLKDRIMRGKECFEKFKFGLHRHIAWEEEILFPLFEEKTGMTDGGPTFVMREEHRQIKALWRSTQKVQRQNPESDQGGTAVVGRP